MGLTQKQRKIALGVGIGLVVAIIIAGVVALLVILLSKEEFCDKPASLPTYLYVYENDGDVKIQWLRTGFTCDGSYLLRYSINGGQQIQVSTTDIEHTVVKPPVCSNMLLQLRTVGEAGEISEESLAQNYTVLPLNTYVTNTSVTRTDTGIVASWGKPKELEACDITYAVRFSSEFGEFNEHTASQNIIVPEDIFCLILRVQVSSVVGFSETLFWDVGHAYAKSITANVSVPLENPYILIATWSHDNEDICSLIYEVTYEFGLESETYVVPEPQVTFAVQYCVYSTLTILPSAFDGEYPGWSSLIAATQYPDNMVLQAVENVTFVMDDLLLNVSWDIHESLRQCWNLFTVTARNDYIDEEISCRGTSGCAVNLTDFCPSTEFTISPRRLQGDTVHKTYTCNLNMQL